MAGYIKHTQTTSSTAKSREEVSEPIEFRIMCIVSDQHEYPGIAGEGMPHI